MQNHCNKKISVNNYIQHNRLSQASCDSDMVITAIGVSLAGQPIPEGSGIMAICGLFQCLRNNNGYVKREDLAPD